MNNLLTYSDRHTYEVEIIADSNLKKNSLTIRLILDAMKFAWCVLVMILMVQAVLSLGNKLIH